ncbi:hypothetical protein [Enterovibrio norvegicus]|uniref:hypothetical protein n=1 Tax=Enterovibrio norvegicus TaxID=188144 RepID=UPI0024B129AB|nr:hypothetical protein [Enterovibrio norvegicus]
MSKSLTVKQAGRKGGNATAKRWKNDRKFAATMRKKLSAAGKKGAKRKAVLIKHARKTARKVDRELAKKRKQEEKKAR